MGKRIPGQNQVATDDSAVAPTGAVGIDMTMFQEAARPQWWLITVTVTVAPSDVFVWGALPAGVPDSAADDQWGLHQDEYKVLPLGKLATALPIGVYHFIIDGLGLYSRVYFQKSAGTLSVKLTEILEATRSN